MPDAPGASTARFERDPVPFGLEDPEVQEEILRRYDPAATAAHVPGAGPAAVAVVAGAEQLTAEECAALVDAFERMQAAAGAEGTLPAVDRAYRYLMPFPHHPGDLYALDGWLRNAADRAGLAAWERAEASGSPNPQAVAFAAAGAVLGLAARYNLDRGCFSPIEEPAAARLVEPWAEAAGGQAPRGPGQAGPTSTAPSRSSEPGSIPAGPVR